jgi:hypothetical protein
VILPEGLIELGERVFVNVEMPALVLPRSLTKIGSGALTGVGVSNRLYVYRDSYAEKFLSKRSASYIVIDELDLSVVNPVIEVSRGVKAIRSVEDRLRGFSAAIPFILRLDETKNEDPVKLKLKTSVPSYGVKISSEALRGLQKLIDTQRKTGGAKPTLLPSAFSYTVDDVVQKSLWYSCCLYRPDRASVSKAVTQLPQDWYNYVERTGAIVNLFKGDSEGYNLYLFKYQKAGQVPMWLLIGSSTGLVYFAGQPKVRCFVKTLASYSIPRTISAITDADVGHLYLSFGNYSSDFKYANEVFSKNSWVDTRKNLLNALLHIGSKATGVHSGTKYEVIMYCLDIVNDRVLGFSVTVDRRTRDTLINYSPAYSFGYSVSTVRGTLVSIEDASEWKENPAYYYSTDVYNAVADKSATP